MPTTRNSVLFPRLLLHSTYADAEKLHDNPYLDELSASKHPPSLGDLLAAPRTVVLGEPGVGKSHLIELIEAAARAAGTSVARVPLGLTKDPSAEAWIAGFAEKRGVLLLDGLDELRSDYFRAFFEELAKVAAHDTIHVCVSARSVFAKRYAAHFVGYQFISVRPFSTMQVSAFLGERGHSPTEIRQLLSKVFAFGHGRSLLQIPRYLTYMGEYLRAKGLRSALDATRSDLFDFFILRKLKHEWQAKPGLPGLIKRLLEKLAVVMEVRQINAITHDELHTFVDGINSDLAIATLTQVSLHDLLSATVLKDDGDSIEFENTEFQEYLAAKEISRLPDPGRAMFALSADKQIASFHPSWFNTLTFLIDLRPDLLVQVVEFSGIRSDRALLDEAFVDFLARLRPDVFQRNDVRELPFDILRYFDTRLHWLPHSLIRTVATFQGSTLEAYIRDSAERALRHKGPRRAVPLSNAILVAAVLVKAGNSTDRTYWTDLICARAADTTEDNVVRRSCYDALATIADPTTAGRFGDAPTGDELVYRGFLATLAAVAPDSLDSVRHFIAAISADDFHGRYGLIAITKTPAVEQFLTALRDNATFRRHFLRHTAYVGADDTRLLTAITGALRTGLEDLAFSALVACLDYDYVREAGRSTFLPDLAEAVRSLDPHKFISRFLDALIEGTSAVKVLCAQGVLESILLVGDVESFVGRLRDIGREHIAFSVLVGISTGPRPEASQLFEAGRALLPEFYTQYEKAPPPAPDPRPTALEEFLRLLHPEPGKYSPEVFGYFNHYHEELLKAAAPSKLEELRERLADSVFRHMTDPLKSKVTVSEVPGQRSYTMDERLHLYADAIVTAHHLRFDASPYRQTIIDFIPFSSSSTVRAIFDLFPDIRPAEFKNILESYRSREDGLKRLWPSSFVDAVARFRVTAAQPLIEELIHDTDLDPHVRRSAIEALDAVSRSPEALMAVFKKYDGTNNVAEQRLADLANACLISRYQDPLALEWRANQIIRRLAPFEDAPGVHHIEDLEDELRHGRTFATPLMKHRSPLSKPVYLDLLRNSMPMWTRGKQFHAYVQYIWDIVLAYFDGLKLTDTYAHLIELERVAHELADLEGTNWFAMRLPPLRRAYVQAVGRPRSISDAVLRYHDARILNDRQIHSSEDLARHVSAVVDEDLRRWVEGEGGYSLLLGKKVFKSKKQPYEELVQRTIKSVLELAMLKRGFSLDVYREPQLLDRKRVDFVVRYGFVGPLLVELKLSSNSDLRATHLEGTESYLSLAQYIAGYGAAKSLLVVIVTASGFNSARIEKAFGSLPGLGVTFLSCVAPSPQTKGLRRRPGSRSQRRGGAPRAKRGPRKRPGHR